MSTKKKKAVIKGKARRSLVRGKDYDAWAIFNTKKGKFTGHSFTFQPTPFFHSDEIAVRVKFVEVK